MPLEGMQGERREVGRVVSDLNCAIPRPAPPRASELVRLRPSDAIGVLAVLAFSAVTAAGLALSAQPSTALWLCGQLLLAVALVQWFVLLHEAGHGTLFRSRRLNAPVGHLAGFFSGIPFATWKAVHGRHHKWTGWQDIDPTTQALVPRRLAPLERALANTCWRLWIPLFSVLYRVRNFWHLGRLRQLFRQPERRRAMTLNALALAASYVALGAWLGPGLVVKLFGIATLLSLVFMDPILLSQHTHIPLQLSGGAAVQAFPASAQEPFTRSLRFPRWFSLGVLLHFDAHELHHLYPQVPGPLLRRIEYSPRNEFHWWRWLRAAKRMSAERFMFQNRNDTGEFI
jgi:acyl-lipid omega-6 desaturase (Delta-12 desaturase)